jgi:outer membrane protein insertion porin family
MYVNLSALSLKILMPFIVVVLSLFTYGLKAQPAAKPPAEVDSKPAKASNNTSEKTEGQTILSVMVDGNQRIEDEAILTKIKSKPGTRIETKKIAADLRRVFKTGYFDDVKAEFVSGVLTVVVSERKIIQELDYVGNSEIDDDELAEAIDVKAFQLLDEASIEEALQKIQKSYEDKGFFLTQVDYKVEDLSDPPGAVKLKIIIDEKKKVKIKKVRFIGNKGLTEETLKARMLTKPGSLFGGGNYKEEDINRDFELLKFLYLNEGYAQVRIDPPKTIVSPDKSGIEVIFKIEEGPRFKIGEITFQGDLLKTPEEFLEVMNMDDQEYFSQQVIMRDLSELQAIYGDKGYAYANIVPRPLMNAKTEIMDLVFQIDQGDKVSIGEIKITGNTKTRDKVIRREMKLIEGELYNETAKRNSVANLNRLGFFKAVDVQPNTDSGSSDVMDLNIQVEETSTGTLNLGVGFGGFQGFAVQGSLNQTNLFGEGKNVGFSINWSENINRLFNLNYTDPYFLDTLWSLGVDAYQTLRFLPDFQETRVGGAIRLGRMLDDYWRTSVRYRLDETDVRFDPNRRLNDIYPVELEEESEGFTSSLTWFLEYDRRNNRMFPTSGFYTNLSFEYTGIGGDLNYSEASLNMRYYKPIIGSLVWRNNFVYGLLTSNESGRDVPISQLYRLGGANTIRGYNWFTISKRKFSNDAFNQLDGDGDQFAAFKARRPFGGTQQFYYNLEFEWAMVQEAGIKGVVFFDVGQAEDSLSLSRLKSAYGAGIRWISPLGPLRFEWGFPVDPDERFGEEPMVFDFSISSTF